MDEDQYLTPREAAAMLHKDRETIYRMVRAGELVAVRVRTRSLLITRKSVEAAFKPVKSCD